ncbi:MAG: RNA methyltransferase [Betaproteobacteria bacterium]|nr:RNA methyltransferase [Betaproteobacteria bacterium]MCC6246914.1 RNA methyltransferase [Rubrivivax sp.]MCL4697999.1 RNA methyltransferase [Burkholderiaceae bacterium]
MPPSAVQVIRSRSNPLLVQLRQLAQEAGAYRRAGTLWLEGDHLCRAALARGWVPQQVVFDERALDEPALQVLAHAAARVVVLPGPLFASISTLESPAGVGWLVDLPAPAEIDPLSATLVLDRVQDAGNVGSILRSAAAFGVRQVLALKGTASLWAPKVLRAGMGAHFGLALREGLEVDALGALRVPLVATDSHAAAALPEADLPDPCAWVLGHEGQGIAAELRALAALEVRIPQPGGEESLNVAAAAAVCLYESMRRRGAGA